MVIIMMNKEFYEEFYQKGGSYLIPTEIFNELLDELEETIELQQENFKMKIENKELKEELNQKNKIIEEIKILIKNYKDLCKDKGLYMNLTVSMIEDILKGDSNE